MDRKLTTKVAMVVAALAIMSSARPAGADLQAVCSSTGAGGNWNVAASWTNCGGVAPAATDSVIITSGAPINTNGNRTIVDVTIDSGATLTLSSGNTLTINGTTTGLT